MPRRAAGVSLVEVLVAITVMALAMSIAMVLYDGARRSFKVGDNLTEQQQIVRIAFDKLSRDLRLSGYNHNPDGDKTRPDEQIEAAFETAIVIRADFDGADLTQAATPEDALAGSGGAFLAVSTGNDEIVGYVLAKSGSPDTLSFEADVVGNPRDGVVEAIDVANVSLDQNDPPYTLYRLTVADDSASVQRVPLVENVRSLRFKYYDATGVPIPAPGGLDDADGDGPRARGEIRRIEIEIEGLTRDPSQRWSDPDDPDPDTRDYRKFQLAGDVTPPNLGRFGLKDIEANVAPPSQPPPPALHAGHCEGLYVTWAPNPPQDEVARYELRYGTDPAALAGPLYAVEPRLYVDNLLDGTDYYVTVEAVDDSGNVSLPSDASTLMTANTNELETPANFAVSTGNAGWIDLSWDAVTDNVPPAPPAEDPIAPRHRDFARYWVYRDAVANFTLDGSKRVVSVTDPLFTDRAIVNCRNYFYRVTAEDRCDSESVETDAFLGNTIYTIAPEPPQNVQAFGPAVTLRWDAVTRDVNGDPIHIEDYRVFRTAAMGAGAIPDPDTDFFYRDTVSNQTYYRDNILPVPGSTYFYYVTAKDDCPNESARSEIAELGCSFSGDVTVSANPGASITVDVVGGTASYTLQLTIQRPPLPDATPIVVNPAPGPPWSQGWPAGLPGLYRIDAAVLQSNGCVQSSSLLVTLE